MYSIVLYAYVSTFDSLRYSHDDDRNKSNRRLHCNYFGHLKSDSSACVAMTGCLGKDDIDFTLTSDHLYEVNSFTWKRDGTVQASAGINRVITTFK